IPIVADSDVSFQLLYVLFQKHLRYQSHALMTDDALAVRGRYPRTFLPAMLESEKPEERYARDVEAVAKNAKYSAFLAEVLHSTILTKNSCKKKADRSGVILCRE